jgi:hypothetical protein
MIQDITYETAFLYFDVPTSGSITNVTAYSYDGDNYDATITEITGSMGGETSVVFIN